MTIRHHLSEQLLTGYAAGQLPEAFNLIVATHVSLCDECRARLAALEVVGGAILEDIEEIAETYLRNPIRVQVAPPGKPIEKIVQGVHFIPNGDKARLLEDYLK